MPGPAPAADPPARDTLSIERVVAAFVSAMAERDGERYADQIDVRRLLRESERVAGGRWMADPFLESRMVETMRQGLVLGASLLAAAPDLYWESADVLEVRFGPDVDEAIAIVRIRDPISETPVRGSLSLRRRLGRWRIYDMDVPAMGFRMAELVSHAFTDSPEELATLREATARRVPLLQARAEGRHEEALAMLADLRALPPPEFMVPHLDLLEADLLLALGRTEAALTLATRSGLPAARRIEAASLLALDRPAEADAAASLYLESAGDDPAGWRIRAAALEALGRPVEAMEAARRAEAGTWR